MSKKEAIKKDKPANHGAAESKDQSEGTPEKRLSITLTADNAEYIKVATLISGESIKEYINRLIAADRANASSDTKSAMETLKGLLKRG